MKVLGWIGAILAVYVVFVLAFDGVFLGYFQPKLEASGIPMLVLTTTDDAGATGDRMLARIELTRLYTFPLTIGPVAGITTPSLAPTCAHRSTA